MTTDTSRRAQRCNHTGQDLWAQLSPEAHKKAAHSTGQRTPCKGPVSLTPVSQASCKKAATQQELRRPNSPGLQQRQELRTAALPRDTNRHGRNAMATSPGGHTALGMHRPALSGQHTRCGRCEACLRPPLLSTRRTAGWQLPPQRRSSCEHRHNSTLLAPALAQQHVAGGGGHQRSSAEAQAAAAHHWMPKKRAMSMKFSPPMTLFAKRMATVVPYAICTHCAHCRQTRDEQASTLAGTRHAGRGRPCVESSL